jgi:hypothetical protein
MLLLKNSEPKELMYLQLFAMSLTLNKGRIWLTKLSRWVSSIFCFIHCFTIYEARTLLKLAVSRDGHWHLWLH